MILPPNMKFLKMSFNQQTNNLRNILSSKDNASNVPANSNLENNYSYKRNYTTVSEVFENSKTQNSKDENKSYNTIYDDTLNVTKKIISPLYFENLSPQIKDLLVKRNCKTFPCFQDFEDEPDVFKTRKIIYKEGCDVSRKFLKVKLRWSYQRTITPNSKSFRVCTLPKVRYKKFFMYYKIGGLRA